MYSYIDPGTGSMLLSLFIGIAAAAVFGIRALIIKLQFIFSGGKANSKLDSKNIPYVIYSDHKRYWNVFKPICDEFEKRKINLVFYTSSPDDPALSKKYNYVSCSYIGEGNKAFVKLNMLHADILISTTPGLDVYQWKRSRYVKYYIHIPHSADDLAAYRMFGLDYYDAVLTSGQNQVDLIKKIEELRPSIKRKDIVTIGSIPLDNLKEKYERNNAVLDVKGKIEKQKTVLLAPSWGKSSILSKYGEKIINALLETSYHIIVRPHPQTVVSEKDILDPLKEKFPNIEWNFDNDNFNVLNRADIMISDFSGVMLDFICIFNKPIIYADTSFNTLPYDADWLSEPMWEFKILPEVGTPLEEKDFSNLKEVIDNTLNSEKLSLGREKVRSECYANVGKSVINAVEYILNKEKELNTIS